MNRIPAGHEIINSAELASLRRKAKAHDAYLWATKRMADKIRTRYPDDMMLRGLEAANDAGYREALYDFAQLVKDAPME